MRSISCLFLPIRFVSFVSHLSPSEGTQGSSRCQKTSSTKSTIHYRLKSNKTAVITGIRELKVFKTFKKCISVLDFSSPRLSLLINMRDEIYNIWRLNFSSTSALYHTGLNYWALSPLKTMYERFLHLQEIPPYSSELISLGPNIPMK